jgi:hypothetical protein
MAMAIVYTVLRQFLSFWNEDSHVELRARTAVELMIGESYYSNPLKLSSFRSGKQYENYSQELAKYSGVAEKVQYTKLDQETVNQIYQQDAIETCHLNSWSGMTQIHALASVVGCEISVMYPEFNSRIRPMFNCRVLPRQ